MRIPDYCINGWSYEWGDLKNLLPIANCDLRDLDSNLLVFPNVLGEHYNDGLDEEGKTICTIYPTKVDKDGMPLEGVMKTWDIMGFVGCNGTELTIHSRFTKNAENDKNDDDFFLYYMVQKVFNVNLFDLQHSSAKDRVFDFLICLFPNYLKEALRQGMYKQYVVNRYNDSNVRGMIDVARHIKMNIPFAGKIAYNVREYSYDNNITQLIRHTIEYIRTTPMSRILKRDSDTESYVAQVCEATPSYKKQDRNRIISKNLKIPTHPYYLKYIDLQKLCIKILTHKKLEYGEDNDKIHGLLFSGSWLWEEYLYKAILKDSGFKHPENKTGKGAIYLFENKTYQRYPDYYKDNFILDAKYKALNSKEIDRDDIHQVISYMYVKEADNGGVIHPYSDLENPEVGLFHVGELNGYGGSFYRIGIPILTTAENYDDFKKKMKDVEDKIRITIQEIENKKEAEYNVNNK